MKIVVEQGDEGMLGLPVGRTKSERTTFVCRYGDEAARRERRVMDDVGMTDEQYRHLYKKDPPPRDTSYSDIWKQGMGKAYPMVKDPTCRYTPTQTCGDVSEAIVREADATREFISPKIFGRYTDYMEAHVPLPRKAPCRECSGTGFYESPVSGKRSPCSAGCKASC